MSKAVFFAGFLFLTEVSAQETLPFAKEVERIQIHSDSIWDSSKETVVFTGSSSIGMWKDLQERFPNSQIVNTGFGGSQASDLAHYLDDLILDYNPKKVFIYEGDNDINAKKSPRNIMDTFNDIITYLHSKSPEMEIVLISAKPSISRWHLKRKYRRLNKKLYKLAFIADGLHMNSNGYDIWQKVLKKYM